VTTLTGNRHCPPEDLAISNLLWQKFAYNVRDNLLAEVAVQALRLGGMVVLARALAPDDFGLLKILLLIGILVTLVNEAGIPDAMIQRPDLGPAHEATAWWISSVLTLVLAGGLYAAAPAIGRLMQMAALSSGLRLICLPLVLEGTAVIAGARLRRDFKFNTLALADVLGELGFLVGALALLYFGLPQWSLPGGLAARLAGHALTIWLAAGYIPHQRPRLEAARDLRRFALGACGGRLLTTISSNADYLLVGRLLGSGALGFYSMAWDILRLIPDRLYKVVGRVTLPAFCRLQHDNEQLANAYREFSNYIGRMVLPIVACAALAAPELFGTIYGPRWTPAAAQLRLLAPGLATVGLRIGIGSVFYAKGRPIIDVYLHTTRLMLIVVTVGLLAPIGLSAVSGGMSAVEFTISLAGEYAACKLISLAPSELVGALFSGARVAVLCTVATMVGKALVFASELSGPMALVLISLPPVATFVWLESSNAMKMIGRAFPSQKRQVARAVQ
jgi:PST family polysaccharide transporter